MATDMSQLHEWQIYMPTMKSTALVMQSSALTFFKWEMYLIPSPGAQDIIGLLLWLWVVLGLIYLGVVSTRNYTTSGRMTTKRAEQR